MPHTDLTIHQGGQVSRIIESPVKNSLTPMSKTDIKKQISEKSINSHNFDAYDRILCKMSANADGDIT